MRVALFFRSNGFGGSVRVARFIYDVLIKQGFDVTAITIKKLEGGMQKENGYFNGIDYVQIPSIPRFNRDWLYKGRFGFFEDIIAKSGADIVITTVDWLNSLITLAAKRMGKRVIISEHGNHTNHKNAKLKSRFLKKLSYKKADLITFLTKFDYDHYENLPNKMLIKNPMAIDCVPVFAPKENIILFPSRLDDNKRLDFLLKAFANISLQKRKNYAIVVCGDGKDRALYEEFAKENGIDLRIMGYVREIQNYYAKAKILALTSRSEGLPNCLIEAIFFDCARISVDCISGPSELIKDGYDGFLAGVDDVEEFSRKLEILISDDEKIEQFCKNARERESEFLVETIENLWILAINRALGKA